MWVQLWVQVMLMSCGCKYYQVVPESSLRDNSYFPVKVAGFAPSCVSTACLNSVHVLLWPFHWALNWSPWACLSHILSSMLLRFSSGHANRILVTIIPDIYWAFAACPVLCICYGEKSVRLGCSFGVSQPEFQSLFIHLLLCSLGSF